MGHWAKPSNLLGAFVSISVVVFSVTGTQEHAPISSDVTYTDDDDGTYDNKFTKSNDDDDSHGSGYMELIPFVSVLQTGLPFTKVKKHTTEGFSEVLGFGKRREILIFLGSDVFSEFTPIKAYRAQSDQRITTISVSLEFFICYSEGKIVTRYSVNIGKCTLPKGVPHLLILSGDPEETSIKINGITMFRGPRPFHATVQNISVNSGTSGIHLYEYPKDLIVVNCVHTCPRTIELNSPPGNATKEPGPTCIIPSPGIALLVVAVSVVFFTLMLIDAVAFAVQRIFFKKLTEQDLEVIQWHLNTKPIPHIWQIPPPLPDNPPPPLPGLDSVLRSRVVEDDEVEDVDEDSD